MKKRSLSVFILTIISLVLSLLPPGAGSVPSVQAAPGEVLYWNGAVSTPSTVSGISSAVELAGGVNFSLALRADGTVWAWGSNEKGQMGDGTVNSHITPAQVQGLSDIVAIAAGQQHGLALRNDGTVWAWGNNEYGELGRGTTDLVPHPLAEMVYDHTGGALTDVVAVSGATWGSLALKRDGTVWAWGSNGRGQLGVLSAHTTTCQYLSGSTPTNINCATTAAPVQGLNGAMQAIAAGGEFNLALRTSDGTVWAWGTDYSGQLGDGDVDSTPGPVQVSGLAGVKAVAAGFEHALAIAADDTVWAWGYNLQGQIGDGTFGTGTNRTSPVQVTSVTESGVLNNIVAIAGGHLFSLALDSTGLVWGWGDGNTGANPSIPNLMTTLSGVTTIDAGSWHSLASTNTDPLQVSLIEPSGDPAIHFAAATAPGGMYASPELLVSLVNVNTDATINAVTYAVSNVDSLPPEPWQTYSGQFSIRFDTPAYVWIYVNGDPSGGPALLLNSRYDPQNFPVVWSAVSSGASTAVSAALSAAPNTNLVVDLYPNADCDARNYPATTPYNVTVVTNGSGDADFSIDSLPATSEPDGVAAAITLPSASYDARYSWCRLATTDNLNWMKAAQVLDPPTTSSTTVRQYTVDVYQEKWFKLPVTPGGQLSLTYTGQPGSVVSIHRDARNLYDALVFPPNPVSPELLSQQAAGAAFLPMGSLPMGSLPMGSLPMGSLGKGYLPMGSLPMGSLPMGSLPMGSLPMGSLPMGSLPMGSLPMGSLPMGSLPMGSLPMGSLPAGRLPMGSLPMGSLPMGSLPMGSLPMGSLPEYYQAAAAYSLMAIAMDPRATVQSLTVNTYDLMEDFYIRVAAPYDAVTPFQLDITFAGGVCEGLQVNKTLDPAVYPAPAMGTKTTLILTNLQRMPGTEAEKTAALASLNALAGSTGIVVNLADNLTYPRLAAAYSQADAKATCPAARNVLAAEIKRVVDAYRKANVDSSLRTTLEYVVLAGGADVIPFYQTPDRSGLAEEKEYVVPVEPSSASDAGLKNNMVQSQDYYGASTMVWRGDHYFPVPELAVGRLVETAADITATAEAYLTQGVLAPSSALVTGYDLVSDAAVAIKGEIDAGLGSSGPADSLIQPVGEPSTGPNAWTAGQLLSAVASPKDLTVLTGHFNAGGMLAADYATALTAEEVANASDWSGALLFVLGCHGGYTFPGGDAWWVGNTNYSPDPDWAKAFLREGAAGLIASTGFAYADTDLTEYGERLYVELAEQLRAGNGPVSLGQALVKAKQRYLAETAQLSGVDEKTVAQTTLYGLPMMAVNMPAGRGGAATKTSIVGALSSANTRGLFYAEQTVAPEPTLRSMSLPNLDTDALDDSVTTHYFEGADGIVANPFEPVWPKAIYNVTANNYVLRGVGLRGGSYSDLAGVVPFTTAPDPESSRPHLGFAAPVLYPTQPWTANYYDALRGDPTYLFAVPGQFISTSDDYLTGTMRTFDSMNFRLYYLSQADATTLAATAAAPSILRASAAPVTGGVKFSVRVLPDYWAGVQDVWVLYTTKTDFNAGSGQWVALDLEQDADDPTLWEETLTGVTDVLFMVQAANGAGLTTLDTNSGAFYGVSTGGVPQVPPTATSLTLSAPTSGTFGSQVTVSACLTGEGLTSGQQITFSLGGLAGYGTTGDGGCASATLRLMLPGGAYKLEARYAGNDTYLPSGAMAPFTVNKAPTSLTLAPTNGDALVVATLTSGGRPLSGKPILFVVANGDKPYYRSATTNYEGKAPLGALPLPEGTYSITAYFGGAVAATVDLGEDRYYSSSQAFGPLTIADVYGPGTPIPMGTSAYVSARFGDNVVNSSGMCAFDWGDGYNTTVFLRSSSGTCSASHTYYSTGVYTVDVTLGSATSSFEYVVVYDPSAGFVTGGGWIDSPSGAYTPADSTDTDVVGRATFGFVSKYKKGMTVPEGDTAFQFAAAGLNFESVSYNWLVLANATAKYKGEGTINDQIAPNGAYYKFMLFAVDGQIAGDGFDRFRIRIWYESGGAEYVVYDNQPDDALDEDASTAIGGGNIVIHSTKK